MNDTKYTPEFFLDEMHAAFRLYNDDFAEDIGFGREGDTFFAEVYNEEGEIVGKTTFTVEFR